MVKCMAKCILPISTIQGICCYKAIIVLKENNTQPLSVAYNKCYVLSLGSQKIPPVLYSLSDIPLVEVKTINDIRVYISSDILIVLTLPPRHIYVPCALLLYNI